MTDLAVSNQLVTISNCTHTVAVNFSSNPSCAYEFNRPRDYSNDSFSEDLNDSNDGNTPVVSSSFSKCGQLFVCCCRKYLCAWYVDGWKLIGKKTIQRSANKVIFSPSNNIIVADKSGDVYLHLLKDFITPGTLLLGHLSMLLDVLVTPDEKYIITCDRDEKIRVSLYPRSYIINSYCLGHEEFVTYIHLLPHDSSVLVSSGGDGTIRFWNYYVGKELLSHSLEDDIPDVSEGNISQIISSRGILSQVDSNSSLLFSSVFKISCIYLHLIKNVGSHITCKLSQIMKTDYFPLCFQICEKYKLLWVLLQNEVKPLLGFELNFDNCKISNANPVCEVQRALKKHSSILRNTDLHERFISSLAKKRVDNEGEYYKRKQERLEKNKVKKLAT